MIFNPHITLEDEDFRLVPMRDEHFDDLYKVSNNKTLWEQHPQHDRWKLDVFKGFFKVARENPAGAFVFFDKKTQDVMGSARYYEVDEDGGSVKIGYTFIDPSYWGGPTNSKIKKLMLTHAFESFDKVYFDIGVNNFRSQKACEKIGCHRLDGVINGNYTYALEKKVWEQP